VEHLAVLPERRAVDHVAAGVTAPAQVTVLARAHMRGDETVASEQVAATALLWREHHPLVLGVQNRIANFAAHSHLYSDDLTSRLPTAR
jgi:hypothetical protein